jgi:hypothetical protein
MVLTLADLITLVQAVVIQMRAIGRSLAQLAAPGAHVDGDGSRPRSTRGAHAARHDRAVRRGTNLSREDACTLCRLAADLRVTQTKRHPLHDQDDRAWVTRKRHSGIANPNPGSAIARHGKSRLACSAQGAMPFCRELMPRSESRHEPADDQPSNHHGIQVVIAIVSLHNAAGARQLK